MANEFFQNLYQTLAFASWSRYTDTDYLKVIEQNPKYLDIIENHFPIHALIVALRKVKSPLVETIHEVCKQKNGLLAVYDLNTAKCNRLEANYDQANLRVMPMNYIENTEPSNRYSVIAANQLCHLVPFNVIEQIVLVSLDKLKVGGLFTASIVPHSVLRNYEADLVTPAFESAINKYNGLKPDLEIKSDTIAGTIYFVTKRG